MIRLLLRAAPARFRAAPALGLLPVLAIALGAGAVLSVQLVNRAALETLDASLEVISAGTDLVVTGLVEEAGSVPDEAWPATLAIPGVRRAAPVLRLAGLRVGTLDREASVPAWGVDMVSGSFDFTGSGGEEGTLAPEVFFAGGIVLPRRVADRLGVGLLDPVWIGSDGAGPGSRRPTLVAGTYPGEEGRASAFLDLAYAQALRGRPGLDRIELSVAGGSDVESIRSALAARIPGVRIEESGTLRAEGAELFSAFRLNLLALSAVSLLVAAFLVYASVRAALAARRQEIGLYRALGASGRRVGVLLLGEVFLMALAGAALGIPVGAVAAGASLDRVSATISNLYLLERIESLTVDPQVVVLAGVVAVAAALAGAAPQVFAEASRAPVTLLAPGRASLSPGRRRFWLLGPPVAGTTLIGTAVWAALDPGSWPALVGSGFGAAGALLVGAALLPDAVIRLAAGFRAGQNSAVGRGVLAALREPGSTGPPAAALVVAVAMLVGVSSLIGSFRATLDTWLGETLAADIYVSRAGGAGGARSIASERRALSAEALAVTAADPDVRERDLLRAQRVRLEGRPVAVLGVDAALPAAGDRFSILGDRKAALAGFEEGELLVSEPLARRLDLGAGAALPLPAATPDRPLRVAGVYRDYGNEQGALFLDRTLMNSLYPPEPGTPAPVHGAALYLRDGADRAAAVARLERALGPSANVVDNAALRSRALDVFDQTMAVTGLLRVFALVIAALGVGLFLWTQVRERAPEAALERALGANRGQVASGFLGRTLVIIGIALLVGGGAGAVLTLLLVHVVNPLWFGWTLTLHWPLDVLASQAAAVVLAGLLAAVLPARLASRVDATGLRQEI
ncbi:MAG: ABC transporter permease [Acidobacteriota bacterium]|nr:ABC transporter permease [Acidobacteriota bacterium]